VTPRSFGKALRAAIDQRRAFGVCCANLEATGLVLRKPTMAPSRVPIQTVFQKIARVPEACAGSAFEVVDKGPNPIADRT
jgi:hypothetical protein